MRVEIGEPAFCGIRVMTLRTSIALVSTFLIGATHAAAQVQPTPAANTESHPGVKIGDPAPEIGSVTWEYGEGVKSLEAGRVYAIVFSASSTGTSGLWSPGTDTNSICAAAARSLPREMGAVVLSQGCSAEGGNTHFKPGAAGFSVACNMPNDMTSKWMGDKVRWYETAVVVDADRRVAWIGGVADMPFVLEQVRAKRFDAAAFEKEANEYQQHFLAARAASRKGDAPEARSRMDAAIASLPHRRAMAEAYWFDMVSWLEARSAPEVRAEALRNAAQRVFDTATLADAGAVQSIITRIGGLSEKEAEANTRTALTGQKRLVELSGMNDYRFLIGAARLHAELGEWDEARTSAALALSAAPEHVRPGISKQLEAYGEKRMPTP